MIRPLDRYGKRTTPEDPLGGRTCSEDQWKTLLGLRIIEKA
jgi:hypothetical protein